MALRLLEFAISEGERVVEKLPKAERKTLGQFITPGPIARLMARRLITGAENGIVTVLDPAAGTGVLAAAVVEELLLSEDPPKLIQVVLYEIDVRLVGSLRTLTARMRGAAKDLGVAIAISIRNKDFLLCGDTVKQRATADIVISNPPYFKINAADPRARAHSYAVYGQPNIYGLFMAAASNLVAPNGRWCFITPRSWTNGAYFSGVRKSILKNLTIESFHLFGSRTDHFSNDEILQEAMITWASAQTDRNAEVLFSASEGVEDLDDALLSSVPLSRVVSSDAEQLISLQADSSGPLSTYTTTLETLGLRVSTGPVVAFRANKYLKEQRTKNSIPLLWMQHVGHMLVRWPLQKKKEHFVPTAASAWMLVPNEPMVILRRFSPKEDQRRITAAPYTGSLPGKMIGLENHLNYIYRPNGSMTVEEAYGLAAYLNSTMVDKHLRAIAGSTQVNASELRKLPLPAQDELTEIGRLTRPGMPLTQIDAAVAEGLNLPSARAA